MERPGCTKRRATARLSNASVPELLRRRLHSAAASPVRSSRLRPSSQNCSMQHTAVAVFRLACFCTCSWGMHWRLAFTPPAAARPLAAEQPMHTARTLTPRALSSVLPPIAVQLFNHQLSHASRGPEHFKRGAGPDPRSCWAARGGGCSLLVKAAVDAEARCHVGLASCWGTGGSAPPLPAPAAQLLAPTQQPRKSACRAGSATRKRPCSQPSTADSASAGSCCTGRRAGVAGGGMCACPCGCGRPEARAGGV